MDPTPPMQRNRSSSIRGHVVGRFSTGVSAPGRRIRIVCSEPELRPYSIVFIDVRSASAAAAFALTWVAVVDKTRALNDRR